MCNEATSCRIRERCNRCSCSAIAGRCSGRAATGRAIERTNSTGYRKVQATFADAPAEQWQPLLVSGRPGAGSYIAARVLPENRVVFGFFTDGPNTEWFETRPIKVAPGPHEIGLVYDPSTGRVEALVDGRLVMDLPYFTTSRRMTGAGAIPSTEKSSTASTRCHSDSARHPAKPATRATESAARPFPRIDPPPAVTANRESPTVAPPIFPRQGRRAVTPRRWAVVVLAGREDLWHAVLDQGDQLRSRRVDLVAERREAYSDPGGLVWLCVADHESVALQCVKGLGEHFLAHAGHPAAHSLKRKVPWRKAPMIRPPRAVGDVLERGAGRAVGAKTL